MQLDGLPASVYAAVFRRHRDVEGAGVAGTTPEIRPLVDPLIALMCSAGGRPVALQLNDVACLVSRPVIFGEKLALSAAS